MRCAGLAVTGASERKRRRKREHEEQTSSMVEPVSTPNKIAMARVAHK